MRWATCGSGEGNCLIVSGVAGLVEVTTGTGMTGRTGLRGELRGWGEWMGVGRAGVGDRGLEGGGVSGCGVGDNAGIEGTGDRAAEGLDWREWVVGGMSYFWT